MTRRGGGRDGSRDGRLRWLKNDSFYIMLLFAVGLLFSTVYSFFVLPSTEGSEPVLNPTLYPILYRGMIIVPYGREKAVHVHHWLIYLLIYMFFEIPNVLTGFSLGLCVQGLLYRDRFEFICDNPYTGSRLANSTS